MNTENVRIYDTGSQLRDPHTLLSCMWRDLGLSFPLGFRLSLRDISGLYRRSFAGLLWLMIQPLAYATIFLLMQQGRVIDLETGDAPFFLFAFSGIMIWQGFWDALMMQITTIQGNQNILLKQQFPRESIILSALFGALYLHAIKSLVFIFFCINFIDTIKLSQIIVYLLLGMPAVILGMLAGMVCAPFSLVYADIRQFLATFSFYLMLSAPVIYSIPETGFLRWVNLLNPLTSVMLTARNALLGLPQNMWSWYLIVTATGILLLLASWILYRLALPTLIERVAA